MKSFDHKNLGNHPPAAISTSREAPCIILYIGVVNPDEIFFKLLFKNKCKYAKRFRATFSIKQGRKQAEETF